MSTPRRSRLLRLGAVLLALLAWQLAARAVGQRLLLVGPFEVLQALWGQIFTREFWAAIGFTLGRIGLGFILGLAAGVLLAAASYARPVVKTLLWPYMAAVKATPVASIVILLLIWLSARSLSVPVVFLIVLPVVYANVLEGLSATDRGLLEMARVFNVGLPGRVKYIYLPQLRPYLISACAAAMGMAWKSGTAAEVIGIPRGSIGERLYEAKVHLSSAELLGWTVVIILISVALERLLLWALEAAYRRLWRS